MLEQELLVRTVRVMDRHNIDYMLTGSYASSLQGHPRSTHDIDIVVKVSTTQVHELIAAFPPPKYYLEEMSAIEAIEHKDMFNVVEIDSGNKIDFWLLTDSPFDRSRFSRRNAETFMGQQIFVSSPEDTILAKLKWAKLSGGSQKQFTDALRVYEVQYGRLDVDYLERWVEKLDIKTLWKQLTDEAEIEI